MHVENILKQSITSIKNLSNVVNSPVHCALWSKWGTGKTFSSLKISKESDDIYYIKIPDGDIKVGRLYKLIASSLGCGIRFTYEGTLELIKYHILSKRVKAIFILDEAQRILKKEHVLNELKDLSEIPELSFQYIFLGDLTLPKMLKIFPHSIYERILIKKEINPIEKSSLQELTKDIQVDIEELNHIAKIKGWTTLHCSYISSAAKVSKSSLVGKNIEKIAKGVGL
ncbi:MAG: ATP-binding protein [Candidatus Dojkabacteria bacterium]|nr:ATP-binding protein [Candidatus Dojkabacteria bacterium]